MNRGVRLFCLQGKESARLLLGCGADVNGRREDREGKRKSR